jgi:hypothetical protein
MMFKSILFPVVAEVTLVAVVTMTLISYVEAAEVAGAVSTYVLDIGNR